MPAWCGQDGETLYKQGKYVEAARAFAEMGMENPKDTRLRYNRGVAAFMAKDFEASGAAFASAQSRGKDPEIQFRSAYNLGNVAFEGQDYETAILQYKKALAKNPEDEDAKENLKLALWHKARKEQEQKEQEQQEGKQCDNGQKGQQENQGENSQDKQGNEDSQEKQDQQGKQEPQNLDGTLEAMQAADQQDKDDGKSPEQQRAAMEKRKAEALLDNAKENLAFRLQSLEAQKSKGRRSGKKW